MRWTVKGITWLTGTALGLFAEVACAAVIGYAAVLDGASEAPPNASPGQGLATVTIDTTAHTMRIEATFSDLLAATTVAHIHCCTAAAGTGTAPPASAVPTLPGFPVDVVSGIYDELFDLTDASSWNPAFIASHGGTVAGAESALLAGLAGGTAYFNIHTAQFPGGEIRGFLTSQVPEPASGALVLFGLVSLGMALRGRGYR